MSRRRLPHWHVLFAAACGLAALLVGTDMGWGFGTSALVAVVLAAVVFALVRARGSAPAPAGRPRPERLPALRPGHAVVTTRQLGAGGLSELVPSGSRGVVRKIAWGKVEAEFTIHGALGVRQVVVAGDRADFRRIT